MTVRCPIDGAEHRGGANFCRMCGRQLPRSTRPSGQRLYAWLALTRLIEWAETAAIGCGGLLAIVLGLITLSIGGRWLGLGAAVSGGGLAAVALAGCLLFLASTLRRSPTWWNVPAALVQIIVFGLGVTFLILVGTYAPHTQKYSGDPVPDGEAALMVLSGVVFIWAAPIAIVLLVWDGLHFLTNGRRRRSGPYRSPRDQAPYGPYSRWG